MTYFYVPYYTMRVYAFQEISPQILLFVKKETIHFLLLCFLYASCLSRAAVLC